MASTSSGLIVIGMCSSSGPQTTTMTIPGLEHEQERKGGHGKAEMPCAFSALSAPSLAAADPLLLLLVIAFVMATLFRAVTPSVFAPPAFLRPPLRGPPTTV